MRNVLVILAMGLLGTTTGWSQATGAPEQGNPPTELTQRNGFWTANNAPPDTENFQVHVVQMGDTLWALAGQYLENPFLWPQLWEANEHIINPHWIYPEDRILIRPITRITEAAPPPPPEPEPEPEPVDEPVDEPPRPVQLPNLTPELGPPLPESTAFLDLPAAESAPEVKARDLYCSGFVRASEIPRDLRVVAKAPGTSTEGIYAIDGDYVYLSQGSNAGVAPGDIFTAVRATRNLESPRREVGEVGRHYLEAGQVQAVTVQPEFSMARVVHSCDGIGAGDPLVRFNRIDFPELPQNRPFSAVMPASGNVSGAIIGAQSVLLLIEPALGASTALAGASAGHLSSVATGMSGQGDIVYIDLGTREGVRTGDLFLIHRPLELDGRFSNVDRETARILSGERHVIGELVVLKAEERASTALITFASSGVFRGDQVELR